VLTVAGAWASLASAETDSGLLLSFPSGEGSQAGEVRGRDSWITAVTSSAYATIGFALPVVSVSPQCIEDRLA